MAYCPSEFGLQKRFFELGCKIIIATVAHPTGTKDMIFITERLRKDVLHRGGII
jgi:hypothetical protein